MASELELRFDPNTIEHLGVSLYSQLPSVLSELISNSWDADAENVEIDFHDRNGEKRIVVIDDGEGMSFDELNDSYLVIGRNRRKHGKSLTTNKGRKVIGKKGLGKLSVFGICNVVEVRSVKNGRASSFSLDLEEIKRTSSRTYKPEVKEQEVTTSDPDGTRICLIGIRRKTPFKLDAIAVSISKKFTILNDLNLALKFNGTGTVRVTNEKKYEGMSPQFEWNLPDAKFGESYAFWSEISGRILTLKTPVKDTDMRGVYLTSRGKIVNTASFFGLRDNDQFHNYVTGYLHVDFIDDFETDVISTDRHSLNWENDETIKLREYLQNLIRRIGREWKQRRQDAKKDAVLKSKKIDIAAWQNKLPTYERLLSDRIVNPILSNGNIDTSSASKIIEGVIDKFDNASFKEYASQIADLSTEEEIPKLLQLMDDWKTIEAKQFRDISCSRVQVIRQFEAYIEKDTKEVPTLHNFLKNFSWLLDPRILEFRDEVTYSKILKEEFPESSLDEPNRRIDFLCSNALGEIFYVIEIKRSKFKVNAAALEQAYSYGSFLKEAHATSGGFSKVVCYVVGGQKSSDHLFRSKERTYMNSGEVFVKTYRELLEQSKEHHRDFIETYDQFNHSD